MHPTRKNTKRRNYNFNYKISSYNLERVASMFNNFKKTYTWI